MKIIVEPTNFIKGQIKISGSKNAALPLMACSMLTDDVIVLNNVPNISDVMLMKKILEDVGVKVEYLEEKKKMILQKIKIKDITNLDNIKKIRASLYVIGGLVANHKKFNTCYPGGCSFSNRPIDYHLEVFKVLGYKITENNNILELKRGRKNKKNLIFRMTQKSVGTTINILFTSVKRKNTTIIKNASLEPEVLEVIKMLKLMGANIIVEENAEIKIDGVKNLKGTTFNVMSDRIEAGSYMLLASAVDKSDIVIENINSCYMREVISTIKKLGVNVIDNKSHIRIIKNFPIIGIKQIASTYPSFPTDLQQILCVTCTKAITMSMIVDEIYPKRLTHIEELNKANGNVFVNNNVIYINPSVLSGKNIYAHDLRCGFACIVMGCIMKEKTQIENAEIILRGYENLVNKLNSVGIKCQIVE